MKRFIYMLAAFALMGAVSCQPDEEVAVHASFTTDKESYDVGDPVVLTNTSTAENALIAICKWELGKGVVSYETTPENISYDQAGEYVIKLTVTSDRGAKKSSFEKTIRVVDNNIRPVADFTWSPEKVVAGEPVQFTDRSTDEDGEVVYRTDGTPEQEQVVGVYCLWGTTARFKPVEVVWQGEDYILVTPAEGTTGTRVLRDGDQVITAAEDLYDGKVIE